MNREPILRRAALALVVLAAIAACQSSDVSAPASLPGLGGAASLRVAVDGPSDDEEHESGRAPRPVACAPSDPIVASRRFGTNGGMLAVGKSRLVVPAGALDDTVTITATRLGDGTSTIRFEPEGLRFRKRARLVLSGANCALPREGTASIVYLGPDGSILETLPGDFNPDRKTVAAAIEHFSGYAIAF